MAKSSSGRAEGDRHRNGERASYKSDPTGGRLRRTSSAGKLHDHHHHGPHGAGWYFDLSRRPLQMLLFLAPLIVLYAIGSMRYGTDLLTGKVVSIRAYERLVDFFAIFGVTGLYLPGAALVLILLIWHILTRDKWEIHLGVPVVMWIESAVLALPLLVTDQTLTRLDLGGVGNSGGLIRLEGFSSFFSWAAMASPLSSFPWQTRMVLGVGAGLYEELLFRMLGIALLHFVFVDILLMKDRTGLFLAVIVSAACFMMYHDLTPGGATAVEFQLAIFYFLSGLYFGALFVLRGFGIAVGVHAIYDILVIVILPSVHSLSAASY